MKNQTFISQTNNQTMASTRPTDEMLGSDAPCAKSPKVEVSESKELGSDCDDPAESDLATRTVLWDKRIKTFYADGNVFSCITQDVDEVYAFGFYWPQVEKCLRDMGRSRPSIGLIGLEQLCVLNSLCRDVLVRQFFKCTIDGLNGARVKLARAYKDALHVGGRCIDAEDAVAAKDMLDVCVHFVDILKTRLDKSLPRIETFSD